MAGRGGFKHRLKRLRQKRMQSKRKGRENVRRARGIFEAKGEGWAPLENNAQLAALSHAGRRVAQRPEPAQK